MAGAQPASRRLLTEGNAAATYIPLGQKGAASGVATLGSDQKVPSAQLPNIPVLLTASKATDTSRTAVTTTADDPELVLSAVPVGLYVVELQLQEGNPSATNAPGIRLLLGGTAVMTVPGLGALWAGAGASLTAWTPNTALTGLCTGTTYNGINSPILARGRVRVTTAGSVTLAWAQSTSQSTATVLAAGSMLSLTKVA
jgi:hypothetical protein